MIAGLDPADHHLGKTLGSFTYPNGHEVPRIQILTVQDLLDGKRPDFLDYGEGSAMNKQAKREIVK